MLVRCRFCGYIGKDEVIYEYIGGLGEVPICLDRNACMIRRIENNTCKKCGGNIVTDYGESSCLQCGEPKYRPHPIVETDKQGYLMKGGQFRGKRKERNDASY